MKATRLLLMSGISPLRLISHLASRYGEMWRSCLVWNIVIVCLCCICTIGSVSAQCIDYSNYLHWVGSVYTPWYAEDVAVAGSYAYVAGGYSGLQVIDIADPQYPHIVYNLDSLRSAFGVSVSGNNAYVTDWDSLWVLNISNSEHPQIEGSLYIPGCEDVAISGNYAYVIVDYNIIIVDISNPANSQIVGNIDLPNGVSSIATTGTYIYVTSISNLQIFDITAPASPQIVGSMDLAGGCIVISGDYAYITDYISRLYVVNITDPTDPNIIGYVDNVQSGSDMAVLGNRACVLGGQGLQVIDISDPYGPQIMGSIGFPFEYRGVAISGNCAYVAGQVNLPISNDGSAVPGSHSNIPFMDSGLQVVDITNPEIPSIVTSSVETPGEAGSIAISGVYAYIADSESGLQLIDITNPLTPQIVGSVDTPDYAYDVAISDSIACVADHSSLQIININNPYNPEYAGSVEIGVYYAWDSVAISGNNVYVADYWTGLYAIDISNIYSPMIVNAVNTPGYAVDVAISGTYAYVADGTCGLQVIDINNPATLQIVGSVETPYWASKVVVSGDYAFVANEYRLLVVDITNPASPQIVSSVQTLDQIKDVVISGTHAIVAYEKHYDSDGYGGKGIQVIDITNPQIPRIIGSVDTPVHPASLAVMGAHIYATCGPDGLLVVPSQCETNVPNLLLSFTVNADESDTAIPIPPDYPGAPALLQRTVNLTWILSDPVAPEMLRLAANTGSTTWDVPFVVDQTSTDGWSYTAQDQALQLASATHVRYALLYASTPGIWSPLAEKTVTFGSSAALGALVPRLYIYPNPFNPNTQVTYTLSKPGLVRVTVHALTGSLIKELVADSQAAGPHILEWDGRDEHGRDASAGAYIVRIITENGSEAMKAMLVR